jgi:hypothetical protein
MFDDILSSKSSRTEFVLASEEKKQQVIDHMLSAIMNYLNDTATKPVEWGLAVDTSPRLILEQERKEYGSPS